MREYPCTTGLGPINNTDNISMGLILHDTMAFTEAGTPLGILDAQCWARDPEVKGKRNIRKKLPSTVFFEDVEWKALCCFYTGNSEPPKEPPTLLQAIIMVGIRGGHMGRKGDGMPGTECIWRGLQRLDSATMMYAIIKNEPIPIIYRSYPYALSTPRDGPSYPQC